MIDLWYLNTINIGQPDMERMLRLLPIEIAKEIMRYRDHQDRLLKLFSKLIVKKYNEFSNEKFSWSNWQTAAGGKPYYSGGKKFNISHSGSFVTVAFSEREIGLDIEKCADFDIASVIDYLHLQEKKFIVEANDSRDAFFTVWTRKEAYLKAKGIGIVEGLNQENCLDSSVGFEEKWFLTSLSIAADYKLAVCSQIPNSQINQLELDPTTFFH